MDLKKYLPGTLLKIFTRYNIVVLISILILSAGVMLTESDNTEEFEFTRWPYMEENIQNYTFFDPRTYIDSYYRTVALIDIFRDIVEHSEMGYFTALRLSGAIVTQCEKFNIDPNLVFAIIRVESSFRPQAVSERGAVGLMQLLPSTAEYVSDLYGYRYKDEKSLLDPVTNVKIGIAYFSYLHSNLGHLNYALWAYNYGPTSHQVIADRNPDFTPYYVKQVMTSWRNFRNDE